MIGDFLSDVQEKIHSAAAVAAHAAKWSDYVTRVGSAIRFAVETWQGAATINGVRINGAIATAPPGCVTGPGISGLVFVMSPQRTEEERVFTAAISTALGAAWSSYTSSIRVAGLTWYPSFASFPGPMAPPTPNVPCSLSLLRQSAASLIPPVLAPAIAVRAMAVPGNWEIADAVASWFLSYFLSWSYRVQVKMVLGSGPVPSYSPPAVMAGPVVEGRGNMARGGLR